MDEMPCATICDASKTDSGVSYEYHCTHREI